MVSQEYSDYLRSPRWQQLRSERLKIDGYKCQRCGRPFDLQVHHLFYPAELGTEDPYRDLITLCDYCHEIVEHQKKEFSQEKKCAWQERRDFDLHRIYRTIRKLSCNDLSAVGVGTKDYCNIDTVKADFGPYLADCDMGYVSRVQNYFRDQRYKIIMQMAEAGMTPRQIRERTKFSGNMVAKVFEKPETVKAILKNAKETEYYE